MNIEKEIRIIKRLVLSIAFALFIIALSVASAAYVLYSVKDDMESSLCVDDASYTDTVDDLIDEAKLDEAIALSTKYVDQNPKDHQGYYYLGLAYYLKSDWPNAIANLNKVAELEPSWESRWVKPYRDSAIFNSSGQH